MKHEIEAAQATASSRRSRAFMIGRFALGLAALLCVVILLVRTFRPELESLGRSFVDRFGLAGVAFGAFAADGFHFPIPPQFYMLLATAANAPPLAILSVTCLGSMLGGSAGYLVAQKLRNIHRLSKWLERSSGRVGHLLGQRYPYRSVVLASLTPMAFSVLCYLAGLYRLRSGPFLVLLALRVPKLALYYYLVRVGWSL